MGVLAGVLVGTGLAYALGCEDEFCTVTGLALLVGFFGGPILGGYVTSLTARQSRNAAGPRGWPTVKNASYRRREHGDRAHAAQPRAPSVHDSRLRPFSGTGRCGHVRFPAVLGYLTVTQPHMLNSVKCGLRLQITR